MQHLSELIVPKAVRLSVLSFLAVKISQKIVST
jgi:hypothetical protein